MTNYERIKNMSLRAATDRYGDICHIKTYALRGEGEWAVISTKTNCLMI